MPILTLWGNKVVGVSNEVYHVEIHAHWGNRLTSFAQLRFDSGHDDPPPNNIQNNTLGSKRQSALPLYLRVLIQRHEAMPPIYEIRIVGYLDIQWADWFEWKIMMIFMSHFLEDRIISVYRKAGLSLKTGNRKVISHAVPDRVIQQNVVQLETASGPHGDCP